MALIYTPFLEPGLNSPNFAGDGVDRSRWQFDEDGFQRARHTFDENGFMVARDAALEIARRQMIMAADEANRVVWGSFGPDAVTRAIDGVDGASVDSFKL